MKKHSRRSPAQRAPWLPLGLLAASAVASGCAPRPASSGHDIGASTHEKEDDMNDHSSAPVTWFSLPASDLEAAASFYRSAFGWTIEPVTREPDEAFDYRVAVSSASGDDHAPHERGRVNGCIVKRATGISTPVVLIEVDDLDAAAKKVVAAGGTVESGPIPMHSLRGAFILVKDPEGNMLELFRAEGP